ncbi:MAG: transposase, partial [Phenylobacterium sp.]|nr:transposase [Phenylobacterium sp.]
MEAAEIARLERATGSDVQGCTPIMAEPRPEPKVMLGDQGYDADVILGDLEVRGVTAVIPPNGGCKVQPIIGRHLCAPRNLVERGFNKLKHFRGVATRYDKNPDDCVAGVKFASA